MAEEKKWKALNKAEKKLRFRKLVKNFIMMTLGSLIFAASIALFLDPNQLAPGGVSGIAIILSKVTGFQTGIWMLIINIPIIAFGLWKLGFRTILGSLYCTVLYSFAIDFMAGYGALTDDLLLAAVAGAVLESVGMALVLRSGATTGGSDIVVQVLRQKHPHIKTGVMFFISDSIIVLISGLVFKDIRVALYAAISIFIIARFLDRLLYGDDSAKLVYIISDCPEEITARILRDLDIGVTYVHGAGAYTGTDKRVILCAMRKNMTLQMQEIVKELDPNAFMILTDATEIYGEGYKSYFTKKI